MTWKGKLCYGSNLKLNLIRPQRSQRHWRVISRPYRLTFCFNSQLCHLILNGTQLLRIQPSRPSSIISLHKHSLSWQLPNIHSGVVWSWKSFQSPFFRHVELDEVLAIADLLLSYGGGHLDFGFIGVSAEYVSSENVEGLISCIFKIALNICLRNNPRFVAPNLKVVHLLFDSVLRSNVVGK